MQALVHVTHHYLSVDPLPGKTVYTLCVLLCPSSQMVVWLAFITALTCFTELFPLLLYYCPHMLICHVLRKLTLQRTLEYAFHLKDRNQEGDILHYKRKRGREESRADIEREDYTYMFVKEGASAEGPVPSRTCAKQMLYYCSLYLIHHDLNVFPFPWQNVAYVASSFPLSCSSVL